MYPGSGGAGIIDVHAHLSTDPSLLPAMVSSFRENGVERVFISSLGREAWSHFPTDEEVAAANEDAFLACRRYPGLFRAMVYLNPLGGWRQEVARWHGNPFWAGFKLWKSLEDPSGDSGVCLPILFLASRKRLPVVVHSVFRARGRTPGELTPERVARLAQGAPGAVIVMAHLGGMFEKSAAAVARAGNVVVDISGTPPARGMVEDAVERLGPERVLFGADMPCRTVQGQLAKVFGARLRARDRRLILAVNARRVFGAHAG